jgi:Ca2+-binding RTX toxin-like protein
MIDAIGTPNDETIPGTEGADRINGMAGNDILLGYGGNDFLFGDLDNDILMGGTGNDYMAGGLGNDEYYVDSIRDRVIEFDNEGLDRITASVSFDLQSTPSVEELILAGTSNINGGGNALDNLIVGNSGVNTLTGGDGNDSLFGGAGADTLVGSRGNDMLTGGFGPDRLTGGQGADRFFFTDPMEGADQITDFSRQQGDKILLSSDTFAVQFFTPRGADFSTPISLDPRLFVLGSEAQDSNDRIIYNQSTGKLFYDADGKGGMGKVLLATFSNRPTLSAGDFAYVVA